MDVQCNSLISDLVGVIPDLTRAKEVVWSWNYWNQRTADASGLLRFLKLISPNPLMVVNLVAWGPPGMFA